MVESDISFTGGGKNFEIQKLPVLKVMRDFLNYLQHSNFGFFFNFNASILYNF